jgi:hypothetical protein
MLCKERSLIVGKIQRFSTVKQMALIVTANVVVVVVVVAVVVAVVVVVQ